MPGHYGSHSHSNKSTTTGGGNTNRERGIQRNQTQRVSKKTKMLSNWINSETPSLQIAAMKMISEEHEAHRLNGTRQEIKHEGGIKSTLIEWKPAKK